MILSIGTEGLDSDHSFRIFSVPLFDYVIAPEISTVNSGVLIFLKIFLPAFSSLKTHMIVFISLRVFLGILVISKELSRGGDGADEYSEAAMAMGGGEKEHARIIRHVFRPVYYF